MSGVVVHASYPSTEEAGARGSQARGQPGLHSKTVRTCLKKPRRAGRKRMRAKGRNGERKRRGGEGRAEEGRGGRRRWETARQGNMKKVVSQEALGEIHVGMSCLWVTNNFT